MPVPITRRLLADLSVPTAAPLLDRPVPSSIGATDLDDATRSRSDRPTGARDVGFCSPREKNGRLAQEQAVGPSLTEGIGLGLNGSPGSPTLPKTDRAMRRAELLGQHTHRTANGVEVHIWRRGRRYLVRGRYGKQPFGKTLDADRAVATKELFRLISAIEDGTFQRPSEERRRPLKHGPVPRLNFRDLADRYVQFVRKLRGKSTARDYFSRLVPAIEFAESKENRARWPLVIDIDGCTEFAMGLRSYVMNRTVSRNGHPAAAPRRTSARQVRNVLSTVAAMLNAARQPDLHLLPITFANPVTPRIIGERPQRDLLAPAPLPLDVRTAVVAVMDRWQLLHLSWSLVLPPRPEELAGLLLADVLPERRELLFASRWGGDDFNKARQSFRLPYPPEFDLLVRHLMDGRAAGPLMRHRTVMDRRRPASLHAGSMEEVDACFDATLARAKPGEVETAADRKRLFRGMLRRMGGVSDDGMAKEFQRLLGEVRPDVRARFYDLRGSVLTDMSQAKVDPLLRKYMTGRSLSREVMAHYESHALHSGTAAYFEHIRPLLSAIATHAKELGIE
jgi:hypothetical protein